jgi:DNA repair protein RecO (recombination protein O)
VKPRTYKDEAIVLARRNFSEADRILSVYSQNHGRLSLIAKGVRRPQSRKRGHLEVFNRIKFQAARARNLDVITEAEVIDDFSEIREDLKKVSLAYYFMEVVGRTTHEEEPNPGLYSIILDNLKKLKKETKLKSLRREFIYSVLTTLGFWPKGRDLPNPDLFLEGITERQLNSVRVGKRLVSV